MLIPLCYEMIKDTIENKNIYSTFIGVLMGADPNKKIKQFSLQ